MGRKYVPIIVNGSEKKVYLDDVMYVYKRKVKKLEKPIPSFEKKNQRILRKQTQITQIGSSSENENTQVESM